VEVVADHVGERAAEHRSRRGEHDFRAIVVARLADRIEQRTRAVKIDPPALVEIEFGFRRDDAGNVEDDIGPRGDERLRSTRAAKSKGTRATSPANPGGRLGITMSVSVSFVMAAPLSAPSRPSRSASLRPIMPAAPVMRICMIAPVSGKPRR